MGSKFIVSITVYGLKNFIIEVEAINAYAVQTELKINRNIKSSVEIEKKVDEKL
jgi:hypothetical protein